jgi:acyl dehydratase
MIATFDRAIVGDVEVGPPFVVEAGRIAAYAEATNDPSAAARRGEIAPPVFAFVPLRPVVRRLLSRTTPLYEELRGLHGEQDIVLVEPIRPGMTLTPHGQVVGIHPRSSGVSVVLRFETRDQHDRLVNEHYTTIFFPGASLEQGVGEEAPAHRLPDSVRSMPPLAEVRQLLDDDQPSRYAAASGDTGRYHLDEEAARAVGLPGIIVHGMCSLAFAGHAVLGRVGGGDPARVRRLAVRLARPVRPGSGLTTSVWELGGGAYAFESRNDAGEIALTHGRVVVG